MEQGSREILSHKKENKMAWRLLLTIMMLFALESPALAQESRIDGATVTLDQSVHFITADGSDVVIEAGHYQVEAAQEWLRVIPGERRDALLLEAQSTQHEETIEESIALSFASDEDTHHLVLLMPGGKSLQAMGTVSGVRSRRALAPRRRVPQAQIRQQYRARQQQLASRRQQQLPASAKRSPRTSRTQTSPKQAPQRERQQLTLRRQQQLSIGAVRPLSPGAVRSQLTPEQALREKGVDIGGGPSRPRTNHYSGSAPGGPSGGQATPNTETLAFDYFECGQSGHRAVNAFLLAMASHAVYPIVSNGNDNEDWSKFKARMKNQFLGFGMTAFTPIQSSDSGTQVAVMSNDNCIIVVYRGSQSPTTVDGVKDWMVDFNVTPFPPLIPVNSQAFPPSWWPIGMVVSNGSYLALQSVYPAVRNAIEAQQSPSNSKNLFITGHSLGGGLAILTAYYLQGEDQIVTAGVYTFGGPKVGGLGFRNVYNSLSIPTYRWTFDLDPVTLLPPSLDDNLALGAVGVKLGLPRLISLLAYDKLPPVLSTFRHVGNRVRPQGNFGAECVHAITTYGEGIRRMLTTSQRNQLPTGWLQNPGVPVGDCLL